MRLMFTFAFLGCVLFLSAQLQVKGSILDINGSAVPFASVLLLDSKDTTLVQGQISDKNGAFIIDTKNAGQYLVSASSVGYLEIFTPIFTLEKSNSPMDLGNLTAKEGISELDEVVVQADRPFFEQKIDRTVINVESNITAAGGTALDVLQRSPGVTVDRMNNAIALAGKQGVRIMINGKLTRIPMDALVQMLEGMNAENIQKIELITTPPAKYEAEGDAGMINIVMKASSDRGTNGSVSLFTGYGRREKYGGNLTFNHRRDRFNVFGDYAYRNDFTEQVMDGDRTVIINDQAIRTVTDNNRGANTETHNVSIGMDFDISTNTTIGVMFRLFDRNWDMAALADILETTDGVPSGTVDMITQEKNVWTLMIGNINIFHQFNEHHHISFDLDRIDYESSNPTDYLQDFYDDSDNFTGDNLLRSQKETPIDTWVSKIDYSGQLNDRLKLETGGKVSLSHLENEIIIENQDSGIWVTDTGLSSDADMQENILAGYVSATYNISSSLDVQFGMRFEHTTTDLDTRSEPNVVDRNYGNWFPSIFLNKKFNKSNSVVLSYSRRVARPSFFQLAPFVIFSDPNSFFSGNVSLLPSLTDSYKAEYRYKSMLLSLQYSHDENAISLFQPRINSENQQVSTAENMDYRDSYSVTFSFPVQPAEWWEMQFNMTGGRIEVQADYLDEPVSLSVNNFNANGFSKFTLPKDFTLEISGFFQSPQFFGVWEFKEFGSLNIGLEKKFGNGNLRLSYNDILKTNRWRFKTDLPEENLQSYLLLDFETNILNLSYTYRFGNKKLKGQRKRQTGSAEEQRRFN